MRTPQSTLQLLSCSLVVALAAGCGDDPAGGEEGDAESSGTTGAELTTGAEGTTGSTEEEPTTAEPFVPMPARGGIKIVRVEANPGVAIPIGLDGAPVGGAGRNAFIPGSRNLLIRAYVDVPEDWTARPVEARLHLVGYLSLEPGEPAAVGDLAELDQRVRRGRLHGDRAGRPLPPAGHWHPAAPCGAAGSRSPARRRR